LIRNKRSFLPVISILIILFSINLMAQDTTKSLAFKKNRPYRNNPYFYQPDLTYQLLHQFKLIQEANTGDPIAQHELGMRLLLGEGMAPDTTSAVYWIKQASKAKLTAALYNYGVMLINGWGTEWNPFDAFTNFYNAAESGMNQAQYVVGILYSDNLIVPRDWNKSYYWIKKSSIGGYEPAKDVLTEIAAKVSQEFKDSVSTDKFSLSKESKRKNDDDNNQIQPASGLVFIDFDAQLDTLKEISDKLLLSDLIHTGIENILDTLSIKNDSLLIAFEEQFQIDILKNLADAGSHEAQTILGRLYENGIFFNKDIIAAAEFYIRATILDSPRAAFLLLKIVNQQKFFTLLKSAVDKNQSAAQFVWYGLKKLGYDNQLTDYDAANLLKKSVAQNHLPAIIELGYDHYTGKYFDQDKFLGVRIWETARKFGSIEAEVRIATSKVFDEVIGTDFKQVTDFLLQSSEKGSVLAQVALAYCYENGLGLKKNSSNAVKYYRFAAQRGSQFAYNQLKRLYDERRPDSEQFRILNN
jgi:TPR repeat protein